MYLTRVLVEIKVIFHISVKKMKCGCNKKEGLKLISRTMGRICHVLKHVSNPMTPPCDGVQKQISHRLPTRAARWQYVHRFH